MELHPDAPTSCSCNLHDTMYLCVLPVQEPYGDSDLTVASSEYDILSCSEILVPDLCHISEFLVPGFGRFFVA